MPVYFACFTSINLVKICSNTGITAKLTNTGVYFIENNKNMHLMTGKIF